MPFLDLCFSIKYNAFDAVKHYSQQMQKVVAKLKSETLFIWSILIISQNTFQFHDTASFQYAGTHREAPPRPTFYRAFLLKWTPLSGADSLHYRHSVDY